MHLPDGFLSPAVWLPLAGASAIATAAASHRSRGRSAAGIGTTASVGAFVFAAQSFQFPIPGGASGHLLGGALLAFLLGPSQAVLSIAAVFAVQAAVFQDGGITTLGANIWNGGIVSILIAAAARRVSAGASVSRIAFAAGLAGAAGVWLGAACCSVEMALSGTAPLGPTLGAMLAVHAWIGAAEGVLTAALVRAALPALRTAPQTSPPAWNPREGMIQLAIAISAVAATAVGAAKLSSQRPDGLEHVAHRLGILESPESEASAPAAQQESPAAVSTLVGAGLVAAALAVALAARVKPKVRP